MNREIGCVGREVGEEGVSKAREELQDEREGNRPEVRRGDDNSSDERKSAAGSEELGGDDGNE